jgi:hypothetical protein
VLLFVKWTKGYAKTFPGCPVGAVRRAHRDHPSGKLTVKNIDVAAIEAAVHAGA